MHEFIEDERTHSGLENVCYYNYLAGLEVPEPIFGVYETPEQGEPINNNSFSISTKIAASYIERMKASLKST